ncbi:cyclophilin-like fold protein [Paracoccus sp. (in: a-proteobacteria)]
MPLDLTIADYSTNEKVAHLPRKLAGDGSSMCPTAGRAG